MTHCERIRHRQSTCVRTKPVQLFTSDRKLTKFIHLAVLECKQAENEKHE